MLPILSAVLVLGVLAIAANLYTAYRLRQAEIACRKTEDAAELEREQCEVARLIYEKLLADRMTEWADAVLEQDVQALRLPGYRDLKRRVH